MSKLPLDNPEDLIAQLKAGAGVGAELGGVVLKGQDLQGIMFRNAKMPKANLSGSNMAGCGLDGVDLTDADLRGAILNGVYADEAILVRANLTELKMNDGSLDKADLRGARCDGIQITNQTPPTSLALHSKGPICRTCR